MSFETGTNRVAAPVIAVSDLVRYHGKVERNDVLSGLDPDAVQRELGIYLDIYEVFYPVSLATVCRSLMANSAAVRRVHPDVSVPDESAGVMMSPLLAHDLVKVGFSSVAVSRHIYKVALASGYPVAVGIGITESWHDARTASIGEIRCPAFNESIDDGACVVLVGWNDETNCFRIRGCQGTEWGELGYGWIPYEYVTRPIWAHEAVVCLSV